ncbi:MULTISPECIES: DNA phosphorothioation-dependent restriction protein DptF [Enterobacterales]|jgi:DNA phosphorothioation-dependent restriction protein DptF|uniref:DNA phosphorothioation-dependent restriction protein DptF n=1 Tax=Enterobacterales TaxID=91347 RepID=UPI000A262146|nr:MULTISPECIES: DNA phosphorothioation-dependent restriction protein DptF [Enterobacterales]MBD3093064.1 DNA phosphorothioation-dependent restriction protein DptF [Escherichia coli]MDC8906634.1 DNA phosphorothioation-dependent restriction protein DptF [Citrobacter freundii]MDH0404508.1 DNA phosphorothioation-dependent restriction protein DptF [Citrobacter freundii]OSM97501.1 DNA phosphorothioation-dependent restriction protein DptF [Lonsdalea populi]RAT69612.1 DNA phosphorothioation-dependent
MSAITLRKALGVLAKSSSFSVTTVTHRQKDEFDQLKEQLFVKQEIEAELQRYLDVAKPGEIIFLCGSSGDGKSEILTRCQSDPRYQRRFIFHLDATHSFAPRQSAIDALNELFANHHQQSSPLLIGINTGMLANFAREGAECHRVIRSAIDSFLSGQQDESRPYRNENCSFFDFEHYPKFQFDENKQYSSFIKTLLDNLTRDDDNNLFQFIFRRDELINPDLKEVANFKLLCMPGVQSLLITQLFKARLIKDQFVTTRTLLDFLHHLLMGPGYLFDNLFTGAENDLIKKVSDFDPARLHTYELDQFVLRYELGLVDADLDDFLAALEPLHIKFDRQNVKSGDATSLIRLFWLLQYESLGNDYHRKFSAFFNESLFERYSEIWHLHSNYTADPEQKRSLNRFYAFELIAGIQRYANRKAPELSMQKEEFFLGEFGGVKITAPVEIKPDWDSIRNKHTAHPTGFDIYLKVGCNALPPVHIGLNLFELLHKLNNGYRPNKYDKNAIVLLDELVELIAEQAKSSRDIKFYDGRFRVYRAKADDDIISISCMEG